jgi:hypothetical protein
VYAEVDGDVVYAEVDGEASTADLLQKFRHALPPSAESPFKALNFPPVVLLMVCRQRWMERRVQLSWCKSSGALYLLSRVPSSWV